MHDLFIILLSFIPALINVSLFIYAFYFLKRGALVNAFALLVFSCAIWQISDSLIRFTDDIETASLIYRVLSFGVLFLLPSSLHFSLLYIDKFNKNNPSFLLTILYLPSILFYLFNLFSLPKGYFISDEFWHFMYVPSGAIDNLMLIWLGILAIFTSIILLTYCYKIKNADKNKYKGALLLSIGFTIPAFIGIFTQVIFPLFFNTEEIPITTTFITVFSISAIYSLVKFKYNLFGFSPYSISEKIFDSISEGILITDVDGMIRYCNKSFYKNFGYKEAEILNSPKLKFMVNKESAIQFKSYLLNSSSLNNKNIELQIYHKNGELKDVLINRQPYHSITNEIIGVISLMLDITPLKEKEQELYKIQKQLLLNQKIAGIGFISLNLKTNEIKTSEVTKKIVGMDKSGEVITIQSINKIIHPDDFESVIFGIKQAIENQMPYKIEHRIINKKTNEIRWIRANAELLFDGENNPTELIGSIIDITKDKNYERDYLIAMLKGEETEKTRIAQELHDGIAQYLAAINMNLNGIKENIPTTTLDYFNKIQKLVIQTLNETRNISHHLIPKEIELGLEIALNHLSERYQDKNSITINIKFIHINEITIPQFTKFNLYRISQEFVNNTFKYAHAKNVLIEFTADKNKLYFTLQDDGKGFEINNETDNGIGIINIKQRVKAIGGILHMESNPNQGTKFEIILNDV